MTHNGASAVRQLTDLEARGGHWQVQHLTTTAALIVLSTQSGQPAGLLSSHEPELIAYANARRRANPSANDERPQRQQKAAGDGGPDPESGAS